MARPTVTGALSVHAGPIKPAALPSLCAPLHPYTQLFAFLDDVLPSKSWARRTPPDAVIANSGCGLLASKTYVRSLSRRLGEVSLSGRPLFVAV